MIRLIHFRAERLINKKAFKDQNEIDVHVKMIEDENTIDEAASIEEMIDFDLIKELIVKAYQHYFLMRFAPDQIKQVAQINSHS